MHADNTGRLRTPFECVQREVRGRNRVAFCFNFFLGHCVGGVGGLVFEAAPSRAPSPGPRNGARASAFVCMLAESDFMARRARFQGEKAVRLFFSLLAFTVGAGGGTRGRSRRSRSTTTTTNEETSPHTHPFLSLCLFPTPHKNDRSSPRRRCGTPTARGGSTCSPRAPTS